VHKTKKYYLMVSELSGGIAAWHWLTLAQKSSLLLSHRDTWSAQYDLSLSTSSLIEQKAAQSPKCPHACYRCIKPASLYIGTKCNVTA